MVTISENEGALLKGSLSKNKGLRVKNVFSKINEKSTKGIDHTINKDLKKNASKNSLWFAIMGQKVVAYEKTKVNHNTNPWSKEGIQLQMEHGLNEGHGPAIPPHLLPYRTIGVPDLVRGRSLLPKRMIDESYKGGAQTSQKNEINEQLVPVGDTLTLPLKLTLGFFNGERWSSNFFNPREAPYENGSVMLNNELNNTQHCLSTCRQGSFFLEGLRVYGQKQEEEDLFDSYVPPILPAPIPEFDILKRLAINEMLITAYREEAKRSQTYRALAAAGLIKNKLIGLPPKACEQHCLDQLALVLHKATDFSHLQSGLNSTLKCTIKGLASTQAYYFAHELCHMKSITKRASQARCDLHAYSKRVNKFRMALTKYPWIELLIAMTHNKGRRPTKLELLLINKILYIIKKVGKFEEDEYSYLLRSFAYKKKNLDERSLQRELLFVKGKVKISNEKLMKDFILSKLKLPKWLEAQKELLGHVDQKLHPIQYPQRQWMLQRRKSLLKLLKFGFPGIASKKVLTKKKMEKKTKCKKKPKKHTILKKKKSRNIKVHSKKRAYKLKPIQPPLGKAPTLGKMFYHCKVWCKSKTINSIFG